MTYQAGSVGAGFPTMSASFWYRLPSFPAVSSFPQKYWDLFAWCDPTSTFFGDAYSSIRLFADGSGLNFTLLGPQMTDYSEGTPFGASGMVRVNADGTGGGGSPGTWDSDTLAFAAAVRFGPRYPIKHPLTAGKWQHVFCSFDVSADDTIGSISTIGDDPHIGNKRFNIYVNGVDAWNGVNPSDFSFSDQCQNFYSIMFPDQALQTGSAGDHPTITAPGFDLRGGPFGIPTISALINGPPWQSTPTQWRPPIMQRAYTYIWFNRYIEPTPTNLAKFVQADDGVLIPAPASAAVNAFGLPAVWCYRDKKAGVKFQTNQGTAGPLSLFGTAPADFTPGPSV